MTILFADDHFLILEGLRDLVAQNFVGTHVITAVNKTELFEKIANESPDLLIQDIKFGNDNAKSFIDQLKKDHPELKIIILSSISDSSTINSFLKKTNGYILKSEPAETILEAIKTVAKGGNFISPEAKRITDALFSDPQFIPLTKRELDVVKEIMKEIPTKDIAKNLIISQKTVEMHRSNIYLKLDVSNITGLVKKVIGLDLLGS